ncbi:hypothetical protein VOLCADRAFT_99753 [Volvox carteri f. nagariensis]|uniref:ABC transporter domain-containing protein n=1 Tax=Volvox carteri f. nagariensis TaxID=3068 RepID=D8UIK2_VOLCA|nr:uncharacterized protein VOLCADRAFT_99753 [Volvox carteri f. nagariensis]EFJ40488.1 hypothetical protein VOLCADRAFT_99753 [Volvox carteri f. nagariensis]|eukprot:XP_002958488.1 hypothetical protein VOLCADRAFT_99753 [Volvox carteri f. nagariensis]
MSGKEEPACVLNIVQPTKYASTQRATLTWENLNVVSGLRWLCRPCMRSSSTQNPFAYLSQTTKDVKGGTRHILKDVSGYVKPKDMLAIMGPSGCGKTTLLDGLAGRLPSSVNRRGTVLINGHNSRLTYGLSAYVTQDEVLVGTLTVRETLTYAALLRLPSNMLYTDKIGRVDAVIQELGLEEAQHTKIGTPFIKVVPGCVGEVGTAVVWVGMRCGAMLCGCELITHPGLLFLDEPTSGLDAASAFHVMAKVRSLAEHNRTVVSVIHQPSSEVFELFDKLCLLSAGEVVYFGVASGALSMFEAAGLPCPPLRNPTDHFLHVINRDFKGDGGLDPDANIQKLTAVFASQLKPGVEAVLKELTQEGEEYRCVSCGASSAYQVAILTKRMLVNNWRNIAVFWLRLGMYIMLCICIGTIYLKLGNDWVGTYSRAAMMFFVVAFLTFMSIAGFPAFVEDMAVFIRERLNGYYPVATFALANTLASAPFIFGIAIISSAIVYWLVDLNDSGDRFVYFFVNLYVSLTVVESLMMSIAAVVPHYLMGIAGGAGILGMFMLVCGFFQPVGELPAPVWRYPLHYISYHSYAFAGFMHNEFGNTEGWLCPCYNQENGCGPNYNSTNICTMSGAEILDYWTVNGLNKWVDVGIQCAMIAIYRGLFWLALSIKEWLRQR